MDCAYSHQTGVIRIYSDGNTYEERGDYLGTLNILWLDDSRVYLSAFISTKKLKNVKLSIFKVFRLLASMGAEKAYIKRAKNRKMPFATIIKEDDYENTWEVDLLALK